MTTRPTLRHKNQWKHNQLVLIWKGLHVCKMPEFVLSNLSFVVLFGLRILLFVGLYLKRFACMHNDWIWKLVARLWLFEVLQIKAARNAWSRTENVRIEGVEKDRAILSKVSLWKLAEANEGSCWCARGSHQVLNVCFTPNLYHLLNKLTLSRRWQTFDLDSIWFSTGYHPDQLRNADLAQV